MLISNIPEKVKSTSPPRVSRYNVYFGKYIELFFGESEIRININMT